MTTAMEIFNEHDPVAIKHAGDRLKGRKLWDQMALEVMHSGVLAKYKQNLKLLDLMNSTLKRSFLECNAYDLFWGIGLSLKEASSSDIINSRGKNEMGKILNNVRAQLVNAYKCFDILRKNIIYCQTCSS